MSELTPGLLQQQLPRSQLTQPCVTLKGLYMCPHEVWTKTKKNIQRRFINTSGYFEILNLSNQSDVLCFQVGYVLIALILNTIFFRCETWKEALIIVKFQHIWLNLHCRNPTTTAFGEYSHTCITTWTNKRMMKM